MSSSCRLCDGAGVALRENGIQGEGWGMPMCGASVQSTREYKQKKKEMKEQRGNQNGQKGNGEILLHIRPPLHPSLACVTLGAEQLHDRVQLDSAPVWISSSPKTFVKPKQRCRMRRKSCWSVRTFPCGRCRLLTVFSHRVMNPLVWVGR